jgi:hypothetical protein
MSGQGIADTGSGNLQLPAVRESIVCQRLDLKANKIFSELRARHIWTLLEVTKEAAVVQVLCIVQVIGFWCGELGASGICCGY